SNNPPMDRKDGFTQKRFDDCLNPACTGCIPSARLCSGWFDFGKTISMSECLICDEFFSVPARIEK
ncbi:hypothetical protein Q7C09_07700, partial [Heyndrickxia coagulans]|uniref:hypothetical protein n=1 Tax=Heyndrickxia coagulans TaxID=1398 RepID=UPI0028127462